MRRPLFCSCPRIGRPISFQHDGGAQMRIGLIRSLSWIASGGARNES
jgi:hypothetical protein